MKLVGIVGSIADQSYNRMLLRFMSTQYRNMADIEILDISDVPMFNQSNDQSDSPAIQYLNHKILAADGVIIATPEHNHTIPAALKSVIEWLSYNLHPFTDKPVMIVGASYFIQGSSRAQLNLRQILESPGVNAITLPGNEFLLANAKEAFDESGMLKDDRTASFLGSTLQKFVEFVGVIGHLNGRADNPGASEDLYATGNCDTTVKDVDMRDPQWLEKAAEKTNAVSGDAYVKLDRGLLTVNQIDRFLKTMPVELTFADENNQFIYYGDQGHDPKDMLASRTPDQVGDPLYYVHPERALKGVATVINNLRNGKTDLFVLPVPGNGPTKHLMHYYKAMHDEDGVYRGINEWVVDLWPIVASYLKQTGKKLVDDPNAKVAATTGASSSAPVEPDPDASTGASEEEEAPTAPTTDASTGASEETEAPTADATTKASDADLFVAEVDETSGASEA